MERTIKEIIAAGGLKEKYTLLLEGGTIVEGYLVQERVDKTHDTEGYNIYDMRSGENELGIEEFYATVEPNVMVNWSDSIATKQTLDFGEDGFLNIDNSDIMKDKEYVCQELILQLGEYSRLEVRRIAKRVYGKSCKHIQTAKWNADPYPERGLIESVFECGGHRIKVYHNDGELIDFVEVE